MFKINKKAFIGFPYKKVAHTIISSVLILSMITSHVHASYVNPGENEERSIRVYPKSFYVEQEGIRNLIAPSHLGIEYMDVNLTQKKLTIFQAGQAPKDIEKIFHPSNFPWQLSHERMETFLSAHSLLLNQFDNREYKLDIHTIGVGGSEDLIKIFGAAGVGFAIGGPIVGGIAAGLMIGTIVTEKSTVHAPSPPKKPVSKKPVSNKKKPAPKKAN